MCKSNTEESKILVGGRALVAYGSSRNTLDTDYLIFDKNLPMFSETKDGDDLINAAKSDFLMDVYKTEKGKTIASPQALLELKSYALIMHCQNGFWQKADDAEFDIKFLVRKFNLKATPILAKYVGKGELKEITKIITKINNQK